MAAFGPGGYSPELYRAVVDGASRAPAACRLYEAVRFIAFGMRQRMKDEVQSVLRLATERYGDAAQSTWPYSPGPRQQGDAQEGVRGGGALAAGLAAAYPGWRNGVVTGDMRRAIRMRGCAGAVGWGLAACVAQAHRP